MDARSIKIYEAGNAGIAYVTEDVVASIACLAATEVEGVDSVSGGATVSRLGKKIHSSGAHVLISEDGKVFAAVSLVVKMGFSIPEISNNVQENVKTAIENMTGLQVAKVDVRIANVKVEK